MTAGTSGPEPPPVLLPDAGPLITLAYAGQLELLLRPGWPLQLVDMVLHEVTRNTTPSSEAIAAFVARHQPPIVETAVFRNYQSRIAGATAGDEKLRKAGLGELAMQEVINQLALLEPPQSVVLLFEDHKIARAGFHLPEGTLRVSTRAFLLFLEGR